MNKKVKLIIGLIILLIIGFFAYQQFGKSSQLNSNEKTITIGAYGPDTGVWEHIAKMPETKKAGLNLKVKDFADGVSLNKATLNGEVDVNAFQMYSYLKYFNAQSKNGKLAPLGTTYLEPMGLYSKQYKSIDDLPEHATIAISSNPANTSRSLKLLQSAGLIKLAGATKGGLYGTNNVTDNVKNLKLQLVDDHIGPRLLKDKHVAGVVIGNTMALQSGLNVFKDSIFHEKLGQSTKNNINILATNAKNKNNPDYKKLVTIYHSKPVQKYIENKFKGTKLDVNKPVSYLEN